MKVCSVCRKCYEDSVTNCSADDNGSLVQARNGNLLIVDGYEIELRIEPDSPFELYRATHLDSGKSVLVRFLKTNDSIEDLQKEIEAVAAINHPNLARVYEFGKISDDEFYVVLEDISTQNLRSLLEKSSPLKERYAIKIARQIAEALEVLHSKNTVHRAVSPANIYLMNAENNDFEVKLQNYDFGGIIQKPVVKGANGIDAKTEIFRYFSPEQLSGENVDFKSDIYSLAVVFYEMLLGHSPYDALNPQAIANYVFNESDTEKLHFDLRALLAYTLHQSLQHKLHLRPPTTNNLARQYRHLELVATPPEIGLQKSKQNQPKQRKNISGYQAAKPKTIDTHQKTNISEPEIVEPVSQPEIEEISAQTEEIKVEAFEPEVVSEIQPVELKPETAEASEILPQMAIQNLVAEEISNETIKADEIEFAEIFVKQSENDSFELIGEFVSFEDEIISEDIHITNRDFVEDREPELYFSEPVEITEFEFIEDAEEKESPSDRHIMNSFGAYSQPASFQINKTYALAAGAFAFILFGILITARVSDWQKSETSFSKNPAAMPTNLNSSEKRNQTGGKSKNSLTEEQTGIHAESEPPQTDKKIIQTDFRENAPKIESEKSVAPIDGKKSERKKTPVQTVKKQTQNGRNETVAKKSDADKSKTSTNTAAGMTRPRIVTNVKTND